MLPGRHGTHRDAPQHAPQVRLRFRGRVHDRALSHLRRAAGDAVLEGSRTGGFVVLTALGLWIWPAAIDTEGLTMHMGRRRLLGRDLVSIERVRLLGRRHREIGSRVDLKFKTGRASIDSITFDQAYAVAALMERVLRQRVLPTSPQS